MAVTLYLAVADVQLSTLSNNHRRLTQYDHIFFQWVASYASAMHCSYPVCVCVCVCIWFYGAYNYSGLVCQASRFILY